MPMLAESARLMDLLKWEHDDGPRISRETGIIVGGQNLLMGTVLGAILLSCPTTGTAGTNTGGGTMTGVAAGLKAKIGTYTVECVDVSAVTGATPATATAFPHNTGNGVMGAITVGAGAIPGTYTLQMVDAQANAADFIVRDPNGHEVGMGAVAAAFNAGGLSFTLADGNSDYIVGDGFNIVVAQAASGAGAKFVVREPNGDMIEKYALVGTAFTSDQINFTINDSGTNFVVGDSFTVAIAVGSGKYTKLNFSAVDGSQHAAAILLYPVISTDTKKTLAITGGGGASFYQLQPGDVIKGETSGATATIVSVGTIGTGSWAAGTATCTLVLDNQVGTFQAENLDVITGGASTLDSSALGYPASSTIAAAAACAGDSSTYGPDVSGTILTSSAIINPTYLVWPTGATTAQKNAALAELHALEIKTRVAV